MSLDNDNENDYRYCMNPTPPTRNLEGLMSPQDEVGRVTSGALLGKQRELVIVHNGREYRLRLTQNDKLILTA